jgi:hypothetical protein
MPGRVLRRQGLGRINGRRRPRPLHRRVAASERGQAAVVGALRDAGQGGEPRDRQLGCRSQGPSGVHLDGRAGAAPPRAATAAGFRADRKSWAALRRKVFHNPPTERNRVWETDFSEFETAGGGIWRICAVID